MNKLIMPAIGIVTGFLFNNVFLSAVMCFLGFVLPDKIYTIREYQNRRDINDKLRTSMGIISGTYIQNNDFVKSISENITRIPESVRTPFNDFLVEMNFIDPNIESAVMKLGRGFDNKYFTEWCNCVSQCIRNREMKYILLTITEKMLDNKRVQEELDSMMFVVYRDFFSVLITAVCSLPFIGLLNKEWYFILTNNVLGKIIVAAVYLGVGLSCIYAVKINKPVIMK